MRALSIAVALSTVLAFQAAAKTGRVSGSVVNLSKDKSEITVRQGSEGTARRTVEYTAATQFSVGEVANTAKVTPGSADQVEVGKYLTCVGSWDGTRLAASKCTVRPSKRP
jgi:high-affinity K+ transport system ATPase subunit B